MLGKLIKHSFKANASAVYNVYIAMGIVGIVMLFLMLIDWTSWGDRGITMGMVFKGIAAFALCLTALVGVILTFVAVFGEFERSMYSKEGHLTFTLPVKSSSLLLAKWISGSFWVILSYTAFCLCVFCSTWPHQHKPMHIRNPQVQSNNNKRLCGSRWPWSKKTTWHTPYMKWSAC